ncbi:flagellar basal body-associated FliL family protein [Thermobrachium celere]|uniref:flagellar basal body-associated FliL family protein n=1 Tax=Thermobrachium celere TaxID=53422 RepID=UPI001944E39B|nr:flagellar basal body-associated FliL family protein [Thermobrachium celere]GFR35596.1 flagellar protein FliL [Thermobrachium celere]
MSENKNNKLLITLVIFTLILVIVLGIALGYFIFFKDKTKNSTTQNVKIEEKIFDLNEFVVNLSDENKTYIRLKISIAYDKKNKKLDKEIPEKVPAIRDAVINILRSKSSKDFETTSNQNNLNNIKTELINSINNNLQNGKIINIYVQDIIIQ